MPYSGLTVLLSHPSRFDHQGLLTGTYAAKQLFEAALRPIVRTDIDIRLASNPAPLREGTKVVLLMGQASLARIRVDKPLQEIRGYPFRQNGIVYIPTFHHQDAVDMQNYEKTLNPQYVASYDDDDDSEDEASNHKDKGRTSRKNYRFWFSADVRKAVRAILKPEETSENQCNYRLRPSASQVISLLRSAVDKTIYFDIESNPHTNQMTCFSFCFDEKEAWAVPIISYTQQLYYSPTESAQILAALALAFRRNTIVVHNSLFDLSLLAWKYRIPPPPQHLIYDTMVAHHRVHVEVEKSLAHCISLYTFESYHKDEANFFPKNTAQESQLLLYNAKDVEKLVLIKRGIDAAAKLYSAESSIKQGNSYVRPSVSMTVRGILCDNDKLNNHVEELVRYAQFFELRILPRLVGYPLNPRSPKAVYKYLYQQLGLKCESTQSPTGKKALYKLRLKHSIPALSVILRLRQVSTELGKLRCKFWQTNRWTGAYVITGTKTFRLGSRMYMGYGTNMQNFKKDWRKYVVPEPGYTFVQVDQSGAEALIVAYLTKGGRMRDFFTYGVKPHTYVAAKLFEKHWASVLGCGLEDFFYLPISQVRTWAHWKDLEKLIKDSDNDIPQRRYYYQGKQTCHSSNYDIQARSFVMNVLEKSEGAIALPLAEGERFIRTYHEIVPEVRRDFHNYVRNTVLAHRCLRNLFGYPRVFNGVLDDNAFRECFAQIPQSTVGCITNLAHAEIDAKIDSGEYEGFCIVQNNHDSLLAMCKEDDVPKVAAIVRKHMERELMNPWGEKFNMRSEASWGPNWKEMKEIK